MLAATSPPSLMLDVVLLIFALAGLAAAGAGLYLVVLAFASIGRRPFEAAPPRSRIAVLVPAHNEAALVGRCVTSLREQSYPADLFEIVVIADNCTDDTAARAALAGATVVVRTDPDAPGKGPALRWAMDGLLRRDPELAGLAVVDADSVADPDLLTGLVGRLERGASVVQAEYLGRNEDGSTKSELRAAAFLLFHRVRFGGRAVLGLPCHLVGNGMLFSREVLGEHPWDAFSSAEDLEYSVDLRLAGVRPVYAGDARLAAPVAGRGRAAAGRGRAAEIQRLRWEGGRFHVVRTRLPRLLAAMIGRRRWSLFDAAVDLAVPPLGLLAAGSLLGTTLGVVLLVAGVAPWWAVVPWLVAVAAVPTFVVVGLGAARAPRAMWRALLVAPALVVTELGTRLRLLRGLRATTWERTTRPGEELSNAAPEIPVAVPSGRTR
jgi:cellulose synthase/poly-beta-1,6-N-acetylglucosamine synthase-like glycosyltransferase